MILSDFLSRQNEDDSNLHEIIPVSFNIQDVLQENYNHMVTHTYKVQMRAQMKAQANAPTTQNAQPVTQKATPHMPKIPKEIEEKECSKAPPSGTIQQPPRNIVSPPEYVLPPIIMPPIVRPPPKPPNIIETTTNQPQ